jgi:hypothetical protein
MEVWGVIVVVVAFVAGWLLGGHLSDLRHRRSAQSLASHLRAVTTSRGDHP